MAIACERDLQIDADPARLSQAMLKCQGWAPDCVEAGHCQHDGDCFSRTRHWIARMGAGPHKIAGSRRSH